MSNCVCWYVGVAEGSIPAPYVPYESLFKNSELYVLSLLFHMGIGISLRPVQLADTTQSTTYSHMGQE